MVISLIKLGNCYGTLQKNKVIFLYLNSIYYPQTGNNDQTKILHIPDVSFSNICHTTFWPMGWVIFNFVRKTHFLTKIVKRCLFGDDFQTLDQIFWTTIFLEKSQEKLSRIAVSSFVCVSNVMPLEKVIKFVHLNFTNNVMLQKISLLSLNVWT